MKRYFAQLSGENPELASAEIDAIAKQFECKTIITPNRRILVIRSEESPIELFLERAALTLRGGVILGEATSEASLIDSISEDCLKANVLPSDKFSVRIECIDTQFDLKERMDIERKLGAHIQSVTKAGVELDNPTVNILVIVLPDRILVCKSVESKLRQLLRTREPGKKPFFHPSMMNSTLARVMCNLAGVRPDSTVLDPFCGGGGILCEAAFMNSTAIGMDLNWRLLEGAKRNLEEITTKYSIVQADALHPPIQAVDHIVTDPPYGRSSSTRGVESKRLFASLLSMAPQMLCSHGENICVCGSTEMGLPEMIRTTGLNIGIAIKDRVHSGLVREIVTIRL